MLIKFLIEAARYSKREGWNFGVEFVAVCGAHLIAALHAADRRIEYAEALISVFVAGLNNRLLADDPFAFNLLHPTIGIVDNPVAAKQLRSNLAFIVNVDVVDEYEAILGRIGVLLGKFRPDLHIDLVSDVIHGSKRSRGIGVKT